MKNNLQRRAETNEFPTPDPPSAPGREVVLPVVLDDLRDEQLLAVLVAEIICAPDDAPQIDQQVQIADRLNWFSENNWLSDQNIMRLSRVRVRDNVGGGMLSLLGHLCVGKYDPTVLFGFLLREANVNSLEEFDNHRIPLLLLAVYCGNDAAVKVLCNFKGINLSAKSSSNLNVLHMAVKRLLLAVYCGNDAAVKVLCNFKGINLSAKSSSNLNVLMAVKNGSSELLGEILGVCASRLSRDMVSDLVNGQDDLGMTPLHYAAWDGNLSLIDSLICMDMTNVNAIECNGLTPLHLASWNDEYSIVRNLCLHPAIDVNIADKNGFTALHLVSWNCLGFEHLFLNENVNESFVHVSATQENRFTASYLVSRNHIEVIRRLLHHPDVSYLNDTTKRSSVALYLSRWKRHKSWIPRSLSLWAETQADRTGSKHSDVTLRQTLVGAYATLGESSRKSLEEKFERMESHLFQFCSARENTVSRMKSKRMWEFEEFGEMEMDWSKGPAETLVARGNLADDPLLMELMEAIIPLNGPGDESVIKRLVWLSENNWVSKNDIMRLSRIRVPGVNGERLSVLGHLSVKEPFSNFSKLVLIFLLRTVHNTFEEFEGHKIPLLHLAVYCRNYAAVDFLTTDTSINLLARSSSNLNALHVAVKSRDTKLARSIYDALLRAMESDARLVVLKRSLRSVSEESVSDSVSESMIISDLVNGHDDFGMTPLHYAVWEGDEEMTDLLLHMKKIKVNSVDNDGLTPLHLASWNNQRVVLEKLLLSPDIDISLQSLEKMSKAFDWQSDRDCLHENTFKNIESHLSQFVADPTKLGEINSRAIMPDELQEYDRAERRASERERRRGDENRRKVAKHLWLSSYDHLSNGKMTALHCAAWLGHSSIVVEIMEITSKVRRRRRTMSNLVDKHGFSALHHAVMRGDAGMLDELLSYVNVVKGNIRAQQSLDALTPLNMAYRLVEHFERLDKKETLEEYKLRVETVEEYKVIVGLLEEYSDVKAYIETLYKERQLFIDAANAILVGAALIASISFAGWLQPPLGYQQYYESRYLLTGSAPPDTYASFPSVKQHVSVTMFWVFNSLSFFFAVGTVVTGACVVLPMREKADLEEHVERMRRLHIWTTLFLCLSVVFVLGAFIAAGFASLPTELEYQWVMISTTGVGGSVTICALFYYLCRVVILIKWIWRRNTSKGSAKDEH